MISVSARFFTSSKSSAAEVIDTVAIFLGGGTVTAPWMTVTSAPRSRAAAAIAKPILQELGLEINRTGSRCSRVGPADTHTFFPRSEERRVGQERGSR